MTLTVNSYAVTSEGGLLAPHKLERRNVASNDVLIKILYAGICHSDIHSADGDWGSPALPLVTGHEIVGEVAKIGPEVKNHKVGDIVAVGCLTNSCGACQMCDGHYEQFCVHGAEQTYNSPEHRWPGHSTAGGYSEAIVVAEPFVLKVPKALHEPRLLRGVAPILCAGITTYSPLRHLKIGKGSKVAIIGLGGLGQMGVRLAVALGAEVAVISRSHSKDAEAKELGAGQLIASSAADEMKAAAFGFDAIIDTIPAEHDVNPYLSLLKPFGTMTVVGHIGLLNKHPVNTIGLIMGNKNLSGSLIGGIRETQELLDLCGEHKIISEFELIKMEQVNEVWTKLRNGEGAPRYIIDMGAFRTANESKV